MPPPHAFVNLGGDSLQRAILEVTFMEPYSKVFSKSIATALIVLLGVFEIPREACAIVRAGGFLGVEHIRGVNNATMFQYRLEGALSVLPWVQVGGYLQGLSPFEGGKTGWGGGAMIALRPSLPITSLDPMGYASLGYQRAPDGTALTNAFTVELGGGIVYHASRLIDLELRAGYVGLLNSSLHGFTGGVGLSLNLF
jgi:hypothetical protein